MKTTLDLNNRKRAVLLRRAGATLMQASLETGVPVSTIARLTKPTEGETVGGGRAIRTRGRPLSAYRRRIEDENLRERFLSLKSEGLTHGPVLSMPQLADWISEQLNLPCDSTSARRTVKEYWNIKLPARPRTAGAIDTGDGTALYWIQGCKDDLYIMPSSMPLRDDAYCSLFERLKAVYPTGIEIDLDYSGPTFTPKLSKWLLENPSIKMLRKTPQETDKNLTQAEDEKPHNMNIQRHELHKVHSTVLTHLEQLEAESITIMREVVAEANNPVMLYSIGKDSAVMLHLAVKAFYPSKIPFPLLHVDTTWKFRDMYKFRDEMQRRHEFDLIVYTNQDGLERGINPFTHGSQIHTDVMKTNALRQALDKYKYDVALGGARRDEEKSRAKERIFSFRTKDHRWDPKNQRPELWNLYNTRKHDGESIRVFPISNWTELDIWQYIYLENIPIVPLYFSASRPVVKRGDALIMVDDERMPLTNGEVPMMKSVRFRTLGCYPLTGAIESEAQTLEDVIQEMLLAETSERQGRIIDHDASGSMEKKKQEGYF